jgi:hypothetical protein
MTLSGGLVFCLHWDIKVGGKGVCEGRGVSGPDLKVREGGEGRREGGRRRREGREDMGDDLRRTIGGLEDEYA